MSKFHVGQLVQIVSTPNISPEGQRLVGLVGTILKIFFDPISGRKRHLLDIASPRLSTFVAPIAEALVPVYDGNTPVSWVDCAWQPEKILIPK